MVRRDLRARAAGRRRRRGRHDGPGDRRRLADPDPRVARPGRRARVPHRHEMLVPASWSPDGRAGLLLGHHGQRQVHAGAADAPQPRGPRAGRRAVHPSRPCRHRHDLLAAGLTQRAHEVDDSTDFWSDVISRRTHGRPVDYLIGDEAQFYTAEQVEQLARVVDELGVDVFVFGISTDFRARLFPGAARLVELADRVEVLQVARSAGAAPAPRTTPARSVARWWSRVPRWWSATSGGGRRGRLRGPVPSAPHAPDDGGSRSRVLDDHADADVCRGARPLSRWEKPLPRVGGAAPLTGRAGSGSMGVSQDTPPPPHARSRHVHGQHPGAPAHRASPAPRPHCAAHRPVERDAPLDGARPVGPARRGHARRRARRRHALADGSRAGDGRVRAGRHGARARRLPAGHLRAGAGAGARRHRPQRCCPRRRHGRPARRLGRPARGRHDGRSGAIDRRTLRPGAADARGGHGDGCGGRRGGERGRRPGDRGDERGGRLPPRPGDPRGRQRVARTSRSTTRSAATSRAPRSSACP